MRLTRRAAMLLPLAAAGCETIDNWFGDTKTPLPGTRIAVGEVQRGLKVDNAARHSVTLPPETVDAELAAIGRHADPRTRQPGLRRGAAGGVARQYRRAQRLSPPHHRDPGGRRRARVHDGQRRGGQRLRPPHRRAAVADRDRAAGRPAAPMSAAASRSTATRSTPPPGWRSCWRWMPRAARSAGARRWTRRPAPPRPSSTDRLYVPTLAEQLIAVAKADGGHQLDVSGHADADLGARPALPGLCRRAGGRRLRLGRPGVPARAVRRGVLERRAGLGARARPRCSTSPPSRPAGDRRRRASMRSAWAGCSSRSTCAPGGGCGSATWPPGRRPGSPATGCSC